MGKLHRRLNEKKDEIRLLTLLPKSRETGVVHCTLETKSLKAFTSEYRDFLSLPGVTDLSERKAISQWAQKRIVPELAGLAPLDRIHAVQPPSSRHRFTWGDYAALSYVWGDEHHTCTIILNGQQTEVTSNLAEALRAFCKEAEFEGGFKLWVDAICINQGDLDERARQVRRMREIYGSAWAVIAWLGEESHQSNSAIQLVRDLAVFSQAGCGEQLEASLRAEPDFLGQGCWLALQEFVERPYWYRLWIIQEIVMGASATWIRCGTSSIDWTSFCRGIAFLEEHLWLVKDELLEREILATRSQREPIWTITTLHLVYQDLSVLSEREEKGGDYLSFGRLLDIANSADCKDARDKVYALAGLISPCVAQQILPDYALAVPNIYAAVARTFIYTHDNLEPIREGNPWGPTNTPSWVADWQWDGRLRSSRTENQLWGPPWLSRQPDSNLPLYVPYRASGDTRHDASFSDNGLLLTCSGFIVDSISGLSARGKGYFDWSKGSIVQPEQWSSVYGDREATTEALYRTLVLDRVEGGKKASSRHSAILHLPSTFKSGRRQFTKRGWNWLAGQEAYYFRWEMFRAANRDFQLGEDRLGEFFTDKIPSTASEYDFTEAYSCFDRSSQRRRFITTRNGYMGWAPDNIYGTNSAQTKQGDLIAILFGCSTPIAIRPYGLHFQVIGEAYVQGLMDGEAMEFLETGRFHTQSFTFC
jgi:hypothetical protein